MRWNRVQGPGDMIRAPSDQPLPGIGMPGTEFNWIWYQAIERMAAKAQAQHLRQMRQPRYHDSPLGRPHPGHTPAWAIRLRTNIVRPPGR